MRGLLTAAVLAGAGDAYAGNPCRDDARRLCPGSRNANDAARCLAGKWGEVSQACKDKIEKRRSGGGGKRHKKR